MLYIFQTLEQEALEILEYSAGAQQVCLLPPQDPGLPCLFYHVKGGGEWVLS